MRIFYQNTLTPSGLIFVAIAVLGCAPDGDLVNTTTDLGRPIPPSRAPAQNLPTLAINGGTDGEPQIDTGDNSSDVTGEGVVDSAKPLALLSNVPNPFNPATKLSFAIPEGGGLVTLLIHGVDGRRARQLVASDLPGGEHTVIWHGRDDSGRKLPSGVYFASLRSGGEVRTRKLVMVQ